MKYLLILLCFPLFSAAQTAHLDDERIAYKGTIDVKDASAQTLFDRAQQALPRFTGMSLTMQQSAAPEQLTAKVKLRLTSTHTLRNRVEFLLQLQMRDGRCAYRIDSVYLIANPRGAKAVRTRSDKLVEGMETSGPTSAATEKKMNEIDMQVQRLLDLLSSALKGEPVAD